MSRTKGLNKCGGETVAVNEMINAPLCADGRAVSIDSPNVRAHIGDLVDFCKVVDVGKVPPGDPKMPTTSSSSFVQT